MGDLLREDDAPASKNISDIESRIHEIRPDGRIHGQFNPLGTDTGRFSSSEPNMQNIMVSVFDKLFKKQVPIEVDAKICENWRE
jgi:DNA polymerase I-like protein with 3'-5' exonuclease and polymerase domains